MNIAFFSSKNSVDGSAGSSRLPLGVHCLMTSAPKMASLASLQARVPALLSPLSFGYLPTTASIVERELFFIEDDGKEFVMLTCPCGKGPTSTDGFAF